ncbi:MAG: spore germination protein GerW family protein [bacterium]
MELTQVKDLLDQVQANARVSTVYGEPVQVGDRIIITVAEVQYGGGGGGGTGKRQDKAEGGGGGGGGGVIVRPMGCLVIGKDEEKWVPVIDINRAIIIGGAIAVLLLTTIRALARK